MDFPDRNVSEYVEEILITRHGLAYSAALYRIRADRGLGSHQNRGPFKHRDLWLDGYLSAVLDQNLHV